MSIIRIRHTRDFTMITNEVLRDVRLSNAEVGLLVRMLRYPDAWKFTLSGLASGCRDGKDGIRSALQTLELYGYVERLPYRVKNLQRIEYVVREQPRYAAPPVSELPTSESPTPNSPTADGPASENPTLYSTSYNHTVLDQTNNINACSAYRVDKKGAIPDPKRSDSPNTDALAGGQASLDLDGARTETNPFADWNGFVKAHIVPAASDSETTKSLPADCSEPHVPYGLLPPIIKPKDVPGKQWRGRSRPDGSVEWELYDPKEHAKKGKSRLTEQQKEELMEAIAACEEDFQNFSLPEDEHV